MLLIGLTGSIATGKSTVSTLLSSPPYSLPVIDADLIAREVVQPGKPAYNQIVAYFSPTTPDLLLPAAAAAGSSTKNTNPTSTTSSTTNTNSRGGRPLNRPALGRRVFGSSPTRMRDRAVLNRIVHPAVRRQMALQLLRHYLRGRGAVVLDIPLLFESGLDVFCGTVVVVAVRDPGVQMTRLRLRDPHLSEREAGERVGSQGDVKGKVRRVRTRAGIGIGEAEAEDEDEEEEGRNLKRTEDEKERVRRGNGRGYILWNDGDKAELKLEIETMMRDIQRRSPRWWAAVLLLCPPLAAMLALWGLARGYWDRRSWEARLTREKRKQKEKEMEMEMGAKAKAKL